MSKSIAFIRYQFELAVSIDTMAYKGKIVYNKKSGQQIRFIQPAKDTGGALLEMESVFQPGSKEPIPHYHPMQKEDFLVLEGTITVRLNGQLHVLTQGDQLRIGAKEVHAMWNHSKEKAVVNWKVTPAMETEYFLETGVGIANKKKTNDEGMPGILQVVMLANKFSNVFRIATPPYPLQRILFTLLQPFAYLTGYRSVYKEFID
jgi:quercetin dioxygenase-like cupin family protein